MRYLLLKTQPKYILPTNLLVSRVTHSLSRAHKPSPVSPAPLGGFNPAVAVVASFSRHRPLSSHLLLRLRFSFLFALRPSSSSSSRLSLKKLKVKFELFATGI